MVMLDVSGDTFFIYKNFMRIFGTWPPDSRKIASAITYSVFLSLEVAILVLNVLDLRRKYDAKKAYLMGCSAFGLIQRVTIRLYAGRMIPLIASTIDDWSRLTDPSERRIMKRHDKFGTVPCLIFFLFSLASGVCNFIFPSLAAVLATLHYRLSCADGGDNVSLVWDVTVPILNVVKLILGNISFFSVNLLSWTLTMHHCAQYEILKRRFDECLRVTEKAERRREFGRLVDRHNELAGLSRMLEDATNVNRITQLFAGHVMTLILGTQLGYALRDSNFTEAAAKFLQIVLNVVTLSIHYEAGDCLAVCSEEIGEVFEQSNWYDLSEKSTNDFSIVIARTRMPARFKIAKFYRLNRANLKSVLEGLYSYISLIVTLASDSSNQD